MTTEVVSGPATGPVAPAPTFHEVELGHAHHAHTAENDIRHQIDDMTSDESINVNSDRLKRYIVKTIIQPSYVEDVRDTIKWRFRWRKIGSFCYTISKILFVFSAAFSFADPYYPERDFSFYSGCITLVAGFLTQYGDYSLKESKRKTTEANQILQKLGIDGVPEIIGPVADVGVSKEKEKEKVKVKGKRRSEVESMENVVINVDRIMDHDSGRTLRTTDS